MICAYVWKNGGTATALVKIPNYEVSINEQDAACLLIYGGGGWMQCFETS